MKIHYRHHFFSYSLKMTRKEIAPQKLVAVDGEKIKNMYHFLSAISATYWYERKTVVINCRVIYRSWLIDFYSYIYITWSVPMAYVHSSASSSRWCGNFRMGTLKGLQGGSRVPRNPWERASEYGPCSSWTHHRGLHCLVVGICRYRLEHASNEVLELAKIYIRQISTIKYSIQVLFTNKRALFPIKILIGKSSIFIIRYPIISAG